MMSLRALLIGFIIVLPNGRTMDAQTTEAPSVRTVTVRVKVIDSTIRTPIKRAGVQAAGWRGLAWTDSMGTFTLRGVPEKSELHVRCPTERRLAGRVVRRQQLDLRTTSDTLLVVLLRSAECEEPPIRSVTGQFRGHYTYGFESSDFRPCEGLPAEAAVFDDRWGQAWVEFSKSADQQSVTWPAFPDSVAYPTVFVRWHGTLRGPAAYGHLGVATYEFVVDSILELRRPRNDDCPKRTPLPN